MKKITISSLDSLFHYLNKPSSVFWIRDKSYKNQIYVSPSFEEIWGIPCSRLYDDREGKVVPSTLVEESINEWRELNKVKRDIADGMFSSPDQNLPNSELLLKAKGQNGKELFLHDANYLLIDDKGVHIGFTGVVEILPKEEWLAKVYTQQSPAMKESTEFLKKHVFDLLHKEAGISATDDTSSSHLV